MQFIGVDTRNIEGKSCMCYKLQFLQPFFLKRKREKGWMNSNCCYVQRCCFAVPTPGIKVGFRRMQGIVSEPLFWSFTSWYFSSIKVQIFWDGHKIWNISSIIFYLSTALSKKLEDFFKKLWPSQNNWTLAWKDEG